MRGEASMKRKADVLFLHPLVKIMCRSVTKKNYFVLYWTSLLRKTLNHFRRGTKWIYFAAAIAFEVCRDIHLTTLIDWGNKILIFATLIKFSITSQKKLIFENRFASCDPICKKNVLPKNSTEQFNWLSSGPGFQIYWRIKHFHAQIHLVYGDQIPPNH